MITPGRTGILAALLLHSIAAALAWGLSHKSSGRENYLRLDFRLLAGGGVSHGMSHARRKVKADTGTKDSDDGAKPEPQASPEGARQAGGEGEGQEAANAQYAQQNFRAVSGLVYANLYYPLEARRNGWEGTVIVNFWIYPDGTIHRIVLRQASGHPILDQSAREAIAGLENLPRPATPVSLTIPVHFRIR